MRAISDGSILLSNSGEDAPSRQKIKIHPQASIASEYGADCHPYMEVSCGVMKNAVMVPKSVPEMARERRDAFSVG